MIGSLTDAPPEGRSLLLRAAASGGEPVPPTFYVEALPAPDLTPRDREHRYEMALRSEWEVLTTGVDGSLEGAILDALEKFPTSLALVRSASASPLGTTLARGRFSVVEAVLRARAAGAFAAIAGGQKSGVLVTALPEDPLREEVGSGYVSLRAGKWLIDRGEETLGIDDPWMVRRAAADILTGVFGAAGSFHLVTARQLVGRVYNHLARPSDPFEWLDILYPADGASTREAEFRSTCEAFAPGTGDLLMKLLRESVAAELRAVDQIPVAEVPSRVPPRGFAPRQLPGRSVSAGSATGAVRRPQVGSRPGGVLVCDKFAASHLPVLDGAVALVEQRGSGYGLGAILSRERSIPHVYGVQDAWLLGDSVEVAVDAATAVVTVVGQR